MISVFVFQEIMDDYLKIEKIGEGWSKCYGFFLDGGGYG